MRQDIRGRIITVLLTKLLELVNLFGVQRLQCPLSGQFEKYGKGIGANISRIDHGIGDSTQQSNMSAKLKTKVFDPVEFECLGYFSKGLVSNQPH